MSFGLDFVVDRDDLRRCDFAQAPPPEARTLQGDQVLLRVDRFGFTANNISYAVFGSAMSYWDFFPTREGWGRVPVWGFGDVLASTAEGVSPGERFFGYWPMSTHLLVQAGSVSGGGFTDAAPHRKSLPAFYNRYLRCGEDPGYTPQSEAQQMLFRPLFLTAFLLDDSFAEADFFGATSVVLASASSKTAIALAHLLAGDRRPGIEVVGLTSPANVSFVEGLGCYDRVVVYDQIESLAGDRATLFVDMAGNGAVTGAVHGHFGDHLKHSCRVGATHWEAAPGPASLPGPSPAFFFAPAQGQKRSEEWGPGGLQERVGGAWSDFLARSGGCVQVVEGRGRAAVESIYRDTLEGRIPPDRGQVLSLWDEGK